MRPMQLQACCRPQKCAATSSRQKCLPEQPPHAPEKVVRRPEGGLPRHTPVLVPAERRRAAGSVPLPASKARDMAHLAAAEGRTAASAQLAAAAGHEWQQQQRSRTGGCKVHGHSVGITARQHVLNVQVVVWREGARGRQLLSGLRQGSEGGQWWG